jgi:hypothetical protein
MLGFSKPIAVRMWTSGYMVDQKSSINSLDIFTKLP